MTGWSIMPLDRLTEIMSYLQSGGSVMLPLAGVSLWMWFLIFRKLMEIYAFKREQLPLSQCLDVLRGDVSPHARGWQIEMIQEFKIRQTSERETDKRLLQNITRRQFLKLQKHIPTILVLASVAPLLGLLGTVTGMITTFDVISRFGTGNTRALAGGISEALITTQSGLVVAIPGLIMGYFLNRRLQRFQAHMERFCLVVSRECRFRNSIPENANEEGENERYSL